MRVAVVGKHRRYIEEELPEYGLKLSKKNPDVVISYGGDGTILKSERMYPGIPKVFIRHSYLCVKCHGDEYRKYLKYLSKKKFKTVKGIKVEGSVKGKKLGGMNEINIVSEKPIFAVRFDLIVNGRLIARNVIGDGVVVATPFGSHAYFYSITRKTFKKGLGIAFNNPRKKMKNLIVKDNSIIKVKILRDAGWMIADNNPKFVHLNEGDVITINKSKGTANIIKF
ncbi:MAG: NAD(+)/NADH kinase [Candidatus Aenigmarchaeota archaeon]|nr:NAD(+)/NADH kinase [Candidatus Aenigmarchaeota archaeon]